ncbi:MAG: triacylglycerol lipase [Myxococcota bacterium]|jgi:triacylglycerol lipase
MTAPSHLYLIPGFFGFADIGDFRYFDHLHRALEDALAARGLRMQIHDVHTRPTASLSARAARLLEVMAATAGHDRAHLHLIGHSTGGLDARMLLTPGVGLPTSVAVEPFASRVRSVVSLATPHRGAPLAAALSSSQGQQLLRLLSLSALHVIRVGPIQDSIRAGLASLIPGRVFPAGLAQQLHADLIADFSPARQLQVEALLDDVVSDHSLLTQLRPEGVELINALGRARPQVARGCVVTAAPAPSLRTAVGAGTSVGHHASRSLYNQLHRLAGRLPETYRPELEGPVRDRLAKAGAHFLEDGANDGMVPARSQIWGELVGAWSADHLDIIGHFDAPTRKPPHRDWLFSGSGFGPREFEALCDALAAFIERAEA